MSALVYPSQASTKALSTVVRNISGAGAFFAFLGRQGVYLQANQQYFHNGDLWHYVSTYRRGRWLPSLQAALENSLLLVESTPAVILYDFTSSVPRQLEVANSVLGFSAPLTGPSPNSAFVNA